jgi:hypothetical protein
MRGGAAGALRATGFEGPVGAENKFPFVGGASRR